MVSPYCCHFAVAPLLPDDAFLHATGRLLVRQNLTAAQHTNSANTRPKKGEDVHLAEEDQRNINEKQAVVVSPNAVQDNRAVMIEAFHTPTTPHPSRFKTFA